MESPHEQHTGEDIWSEVLTTKGEVSNLKSSVANIDARLGGVETTLARIENHLSRPRNVNWTGIGSLIIAVIAIAATYIQARLAPLESTQERLYNFSVGTLERMLDTAREAGKWESQLAIHSAEIDRLENLAIRSAEDGALLRRLVVDVDEHHAQGNHPFGTLGEVQELRGGVEHLRTQVEKIDSEGSRRWNKVPSE